MLQEKNPLQNLKNCKIAFRYSGIERCYFSLKLDNFLNEPKDSRIIAKNFHLSENAFIRFLNATSYLGITEKIDQITFKHKERKNFSDQPSLILFWLIRNHLPDIFLKNNTKKQISIHVKSNNLSDNLDLCIEYGLIQKKDNQYFNFPSLIPFFISSSKDYIGPLCTHYEKIMYPFFQPNIILQALRTNQSQWPSVFNKNITNAFQAYNERELLYTFMFGMHHLNNNDNSILAEKLDLSKVKNILDIGGGSGAWLIELLKIAQPSTTGTIYELPEGTPILINIFKQYANPATYKKVTYQGGSFLANPDDNKLEGLSYKNTYDLITLCWILHDWNDKTCIQILSKAFAHMAIGGSLVIVEAILQDDRLGPGTIHDITMLLQTEGRERTFEEYKNLLVSVGFKSDSIVYCKTETYRQMITAVKVTK